MTFYTQNFSPRTGEGISPLKWSLLALSLTCFLLIQFQGTSEAKKPDWVEGSSRQYPKAQYILGVGSGDERQAAEDSAFAAISRRFHAEISQKTKEWESYLQRDIKGKTETRRTITIDQLTSVSTKKVLENVSIAQVWEDKKKKRMYALAIMNRRQTGSILEDRIQSLDRKARSLLNEDGSKADKIQRARNLRNAVKALLLREAYNTELRIVHPSGAGIPDSIGLSSVNQKLQNFLRKELRIEVSVTGPRSEDLRSSILEGLTEEGFSVVGGGDENPFEAMESPSGSADILIKGLVEFETVPNPQFKFIRWKTTIELVDRHNEKIFGSLTQSGREGHMTKAEAENRASRAVRKKVTEEITTRLVSFIYGETE